MLSGLLALSALPARATVCQNVDGGAKDISYDLSDVFNSANNKPGQIITLSQKSGLVGVNAICPKGTTGKSTMRSYVTDLPVTSVEDNYQYVKLNDYLEGAMQIHDDFAGTFPVTDSKLIFRLKVTRRFINLVVIPRQTMFRVYVTTAKGDPLTTPVYTISYSGTIQVPQSCMLNAGSIVEFDFKEMAASLFSEAGAGNRPQKISPQSKTIAIKCTNVEAQAALTMRIWVLSWRRRAARRLRQIRWQARSRSAWMITPRRQWLFAPGR